MNIFVSAIILAAGESRRMGMPKLLLPFGDATMIECTVRNVLSSAVREVILVTGSEAERIESLFKRGPVLVVHNSGYAGGMATSIITGMSAASPESQAVLIMPGDQPTVTGATIGAVLSAFEESGKGIAVPVYNGRTGHPAVFSLKYREQIVASVDRGVRSLIYDNPQDLLKVPVDVPDVVMDIDTSEDYRRAGGCRSVRI